MECIRPRHGASRRRQPRGPYYKRPNSHGTAEKAWRASAWRRPAAWDEAPSEPSEPPPSASWRRKAHSSRQKSSWTTDRRGSHSTYWPDLRKGGGQRESWSLPTDSGRVTGPRQERRRNDRVGQAANLPGQGICTERGGSPRGNSRLEGDPPCERMGPG